MTTRRKVLIGGAAAAGAALGVAGAAVPSEASAASSVTIIGEVKRSVDNLEVTTEEGSVTVTPVSDSRLYAGASGVVDDISSFQVDDRVAATGQLVNGVMTASFVGSVYTPRVAQVESRVGSDTYNTLGGRLTVGLLPGIDGSPPAYGVGDEIAGMSWTDPANDELYLLVH